jgi:hypothetical protein
MTWIAKYYEAVKESRFTPYVIVSVLLHVGVALVILYATRYSGFKLQYNQKTVTIRMENADSRRLLRTIRRKQNQVSRRKVESRQSDTIKKRHTVREDVEISVIRREYEPENSRQRQTEVMLDQNDPFDDEALEIEIDKIEIRQEQGPIRFKTGQARTLLDDHRDRLQELNLDSSIKCRVMIQVNQSGAVIFADIIESSGDIATDQSIISIIRTWQFNEGSMQVQEAEVLLRYYL